MAKINPQEIKKIIVLRKHNQIGDMIVSIPMYYALKKFYPKSQITLLASKTNYEIPFKDINPYIDEIIFLDRSTLRKQFELVRTLRLRKFDLAIIPSTVRLSSTLIVLSFLAKIRYRAGVKMIDGYKNKFHFLLNIKKNFYWTKEKTHQILRNLEIVEQIGCRITFDEIMKSFPTVSETDTEEAKKTINNKFNKIDFIIGVHPGAGKIENLWDAENFINLIANINNKFNAGFIITAGPADKNVIKKIIPHLEKLKIIYLLLENYPPKKLAALINQCDLFISNDTGLMHLAGTTNTILISLMPKKNIYEWAPLWKNKFYLFSPTTNINDIELETVFNFCQKILNLIKYKKISTETRK